MVDFRLPDIDQYTTRAHRRRIRRRTTACLAAAVIFCTAYALILPAVTIEKECPIPEHTHTEECYTQIVSKTSWSWSVHRSLLEFISTSLNAPPTAVTRIL